MKRKTRAAEPRRNLVPFLVLGLLFVIGGGLVLMSGHSASTETALAATPAATETATLAASGASTAEPREIEALMAYNRSIELDPEQQKVFREALDGLRAPCCDEYSAATCCCQCNLARATWGLAKHLIGDKAQGAGQVRTAVADWYSTVNPDGFTGDACFTGGCGRSFASNGCGGMDESRLIF